MTVYRGAVALVDLSTILRWSTKSHLSPDASCSHQVLTTRIIPPHVTGQAGLHLESSQAPGRGLSVSCLHQLSTVPGKASRSGVGSTVHERGCKTRASISTYHTLHLPRFSLEEKPFTRQFGKCLMLVAAKLELLLPVQMTLQERP